MEFHERFAALVQEKRFKQREIAEACHVSRQAVAQWARPGGTKPRGKTLELLANFLGVTAAYLVFGIDHPPEEGESEDKDRPLLPENVVFVPRYEATVAAGEGSVAYEDELRNGESSCYRLGRIEAYGANPNRCREIQVRGDSMEPSMHDGDILLFEEVGNLGRDDILEGQVYVLMIEGMLRVKRLSLCRNGITIRSDNPAYQSETYVNEDLQSVRVIGPALEVHHRLHRTR